MLRIYIVVRVKSQMSHQLFHHSEPPLHSAFWPDSNACTALPLTRVIKGRIHAAVLMVCPQSDLAHYNGTFITHVRIFKLLGRLTVSDENWKGSRISSLQHSRWLGCQAQKTCPEGKIEIPLAADGLGFSLNLSVCNQANK